MAKKRSLEKPCSLDTIWKMRIRGNGGPISLGGWKPYIEISGSSWVGSIRGTKTRSNKQNLGDKHT